MRFSLVAASGGYSLVAVGGFLTVVAYLVVEYGLYGMHASVVVAHGFSCPTACGIFLDQGLNSCLLHWQADSLPLSHQGSLSCCFITLSIFLPSQRQSWEKSLGMG